MKSFFENVVVAAGGRWEKNARGPLYSCSIEFDHIAALSFLFFVVSSSFLFLHVMVELPFSLCPVMNWLTLRHLPSTLFSLSLPWILLIVVVVVVEWSLLICATGRQKKHSDRRNNTFTDRRQRRRRRSLFYLVKSRVISAV